MLQRWSYCEYGPMAVSDAVLRASDDKRIAAPFKRSNGSEGYTVTGHAAGRLRMDQQDQP